MLKSSVTICVDVFLDSILFHLYVVFKAKHCIGYQFLVVGSEVIYLAFRVLKVLRDMF